MESNELLELRKEETPLFLGSDVFVMNYELRTTGDYGLVPNARPRVKPVAVP